MPKGMIQVFRGEQLTRRGELLGLLHAGSSPPTANAPGLPRAPSGAVGIPRTPTGKPILFGTCAPHKVPAPLFHQMCSGAYLLQHLQVCCAIIALTLVTANCMWQSPSTLKSPCAVLLPSSPVTVSDLDRLLGKGVTLCGHACFNTNCSLDSVLKSGVDC